MLQCSNLESFRPWNWIPSEACISNTVFRKFVQARISNESAAGGRISHTWYCRRLSLSERSRVFGKAASPLLLPLQGPRPRQHRSNFFTAVCEAAGLGRQCQCQCQWTLDNPSALYGLCLEAQTRVSLRMNDVEMKRRRPP
jgi:hypothetical protein